MKPSEAQRERFLSEAMVIASSRGWEALSIGELARALDVPRSGLVGQFKSQEALQLAVLEKAARRFVSEVAEPALRQQAGEERLRSLFSRWIAWSRSPSLEGGCPFVRASAEAEALAPAVRTQLRELLDQWSEVLIEAVREARGHGFRSDLDADQLVFELYGLYLSHHFWHWSMRDVQAERRTLASLDRLLALARRPS